MFEVKVSPSLQQQATSSTHKTDPRNTNVNYLDRFLDKCDHFYHNFVSAINTKVNKLQHLHV